MQMAIGLCQVALMKRLGNQADNFLVVYKRLSGIIYVLTLVFPWLNHTCAQRPIRPGGVATLDAVNDIHP